MKQMDYVITGEGIQRTITPNSERAKTRTPEPLEFSNNAKALEFVKTSVAEGYRFSGREIVDREYRPVRYVYFVRLNGDLVRTGQDWGPPDPCSSRATSILADRETADMLLCLRSYWAILPRKWAQM